jgi:hypothetical protein
MWSLELKIRAGVLLWGDLGGEELQSEIDIVRILLCH